MFARNSKTLAIGGPATGKSSLIEYRALNEALSQGRKVLHIDVKRTSIADYIELPNCGSSVRYTIQSEEDTIKMGTGHFLGDFSTSSNMISCKLEHPISCSREACKILVANLLLSIKNLEKGCLVVVNELPYVLAEFLLQMHDQSGFDKVQLVSSLLAPPIEIADIVLDSEIGFSKDMLALFRCEVWKSNDKYKAFYSSLLAKKEQSLFDSLKPVKVVHSRTFEDGRTQVRLKGSYLRMMGLDNELFRVCSVDTHVVYKRGIEPPQPSRWFMPQILAVGNSMKFRWTKQV